MTVSETIFDYLARKGVDTVYMVSGSSAMWLTDALVREPRLNPVCMHHEQACTMAGDVYGRLHDRPGVALVTIGPGATNAITGVAGAWTDSSPLIVLSGQASSKLVREQGELRQNGTQQLNLSQMVSPITKYFARVDDAADIPRIMEEAYNSAMQGRRGPVWLDVPVDIQNKQVPDAGEQPAAPPPTEAAFDQRDLLEIAAWLKAAHRPLILAGQGLCTDRGRAALLSFAQAQNIPVVTSRMGIDAFPTEHPLFVGRPGAYGDRPSHFALTCCDALLILGSRLSTSTVGYYPDKLAGGAKKAWVDIDPAELLRDTVPVDLKIRGDAAAFLGALHTQLQSPSDHGEWLDRCSTWRRDYPVYQQSYAGEDPLNTYHFTRVLTEQAGAGDTVVVDTGSVCNIVSQSWVVKENQRYVISGGLSCMGFWAGAFGAFPDKAYGNVIAITGDGSAQMNIQELATLRYHQFPLKLFIFKNNGYLLIRHNQHNYMNDRFLGVGPDSGVYLPDYCALAQAYGVPSTRIQAGDDLRGKIAHALASDGPMVCEVICQEFQDIQPRIASRVLPDGQLKAAQFHDLFPFLDENELKRAVSLEEN